MHREFPTYENLKTAPRIIDIHQDFWPKFQLMGQDLSHLKHYWWPVFQNILRKKIEFLWRSYCNPRFVTGKITSIYYSLSQDVSDITYFCGWRSATDLIEVFFTSVLTELWVILHPICVWLKVTFLDFNTVLQYLGVVDSKTNI